MSNAPFQCSECAAEFATESEMMRHASEPHAVLASGRKERMQTPPHGDPLMPRKTREYSRRNPE